MSEARRQPYEQRFCDDCTKPIVRRENEQLYRYKARRFCGRECFARHEKAHGKEYAPQNHKNDSTPPDQGREAELYGGVRTNAYAVGAIRRTPG